MILIRLYIRLLWINMQLVAIFILRTLFEEFILIIWTILLIFNLHSNPHLSYLAIQVGWILFFTLTLPFVDCYSYNWLFRRKDEPMRTPWSWKRWKRSVTQFVVWSGVLLLIGMLAYVQWHIVW